MPEPKLDREDHLESKNIFSGSIWSGISEHLDELRNRIIIGVSCFLVAMIVAFYFSPQLLKLLQRLAPNGSEFFQLKPGELLFASLHISVYSAVVFSMPLFFKQLESFVKPGLKDNEYKLLSPILSFSPYLFWLGIVFAYFMAAPPVINFLWGFNQDLMLTITGISFQLPVLVLSLGFCKIVTSKDLIKIWRYVVIGAFVIAAIITPTPDPLTMSILAAAILILYFASIVVLNFLCHPERSEGSLAE
jgi:sec-independent protein translocase protein TatC